MRMWMINPKLLCNKHLLGEHGEIHKHRHNFVKQHNILGRIKPIVQIEPMTMQERHDCLADEMLRRNMNHLSPYEMPSLDYLPRDLKEAKVNIVVSFRDLKERCPECSERIKKYIR